MKNTIKNLINQVKKALTVKSSLPESISNAAYVDGNGGITAHDFNKHGEPDHDILIFIGGIVEDMSKCNKMYSKDALTLAADTGIFNGGYEMPEAYADYFKAPADEFKKVGEISADDLKAAAYAVSGDNTRPVLTCIHIATNGKIEAVDGFRAYRKDGKPLNLDALSKEDIEVRDGLMIPGRAAAYGLKGDIQIFNSDKYIKFVDDCGITLYIRKLNVGHFINLDAIYTGKYASKTAATVTLNKASIKEFGAVLKTAISSKENGRRGTIILRTRLNKLDYFLPGLEIFGSIDTETSGETAPDYYIELNPRYLYDAIINQGGDTVILPDSKQSPVYCNGGGMSALCLPIRGDRYYPFEKYDKERKEAAEKKAEATPAPAATATDTDQEATTDKKQFFETPAAAVRDYTADEKEALKRINDRQNAAGHFENITAEDVKKEAEKIAAERQEAAAPAEKLEIVKREEITPPEVVKARSIYKELKRVNFKPTTLQEAETDIIYRQHKDKLQPIARRAGGLYIDTLSIIAAIMTVFEA